MVDYIKKERPSHVILAGAWSTYVAWPADSDPGLRKRKFSTALRETLAGLAPSGARIWIVSEPPRHGQHIPRILARKELFGVEPGGLLADQKEYLRQQADVCSAWDGIIPGSARMIAAAEWLKGPDGSFVVEVEGYPLYRDDVHLSERGSLYLRDAFSVLLLPELKPMAAP
ncbi:MAG: hypothetical protein JHC85_12055 [Chthoniobacterales bacterium]|nr:hypothetical protein [Chthoniobacterales bacterium]